MQGCKRRSAVLELLLLFFCSVALSLFPAFELPFATELAESTERNKSIATDLHGWARSLEVQKSTSAAVH
jgi:hypothetical protein